MDTGMSKMMIRVLIQAVSVISWLISVLLG